MADQPEPQICRIVVYRNRAGVDMPALITAVTDDPDYVHLHLFPPPGADADTLSYQHGTPRAEAGEDDSLLRCCWRWPERRAVEITADPTPLLEAAAKASARAKRPKAGSDDPGA